MIYKHIIWDWNGTLLDDREICVKSINQILKNRDLPLITLDTYMSLFTFPVKNFYEELGLNFRKHSFSKIGHEFIEFYNINFKKLKLHDNAFRILNKIKKSDVTQSILSAAMQEMFEDWILKVQKCVHLVDLVKGFHASIYLQTSASIQERTSISKFATKKSSIQSLRKS